MISQLKNARANRRQGSVITWSLALLQLPQLKSQVLPNTLRESLENLPGITLPDHGRVFPGAFAWIAHASDYNTKPKSKYTIICISLSRGNWVNLSPVWTSESYNRVGRSFARMTSGDESATTVTLRDGQWTGARLPNPRSCIAAVEHRASRQNPQRPPGAAGKRRIACKVQDDMGDEGLWTAEIEVS